jgi:cytochrome c-type biogenesis protein CcmH
MAVVVFLIFAALTLGAAAFTCWPVIRAAEIGGRARLLLVATVATLIVGIGAGTYLIVGNPYLAERSLAGPSAHDLRGLIAVLAQRVRARPSDPRGWTLLGRGYLTLGDAADAAAAFRRAIAVAPAPERPPLYSAYGEALTLAAGGAVSAEAEDAFGKALGGDPKDFAARYYLGLAYAARRDNTRALFLWRSLVADAPPSASWRAELLDRIALLTGRSGSAPDVGAMVASLAARLQSQPNDAEGWQRLIRAYVVMGDAVKARQALDRARTAFKNDSAASARLALEAHQLKLEK